MSKAKAAFPLFLTSAEKAAFQALPESVRTQYEIKDESLTFQDSEEKIQTRIRNMNLQHPELKKLQEQANSKKFTQEEIANLMQSVDLSELSEKDLLEVAFAWGPDVFTSLIAVALPKVASSEEMQPVAHFAHLRHGLLLALTRKLP